MTESHDCVFQATLEWGEWISNADLRERTAHKIPRCKICRTERPARNVRPPVQIQKEALNTGNPPALDTAGRTLGAILVDHSSPTFRAKSLTSKANRKGIVWSLAEEWLEKFLAAGWVRLTWDYAEDRKSLREIFLLRPELLEEFVRPGEKEKRRNALASAIETVGKLTHPFAQDIKALLTDPAATEWSVLLIRAIAALAVHVESDETLAERVFSTRYLGDSKSLSSVKHRLESLVGNLESLGIREGLALTLVGGQGKIILPETLLDISKIGPFLGLARETILSIESLQLPPDGLFVVENQTVFEACCRGEVPKIGEVMVVWSSGYPGRAVRALVELAAASQAEIRIWSDLDLAGIRIARLVQSWGGENCRAYRMSTNDVAEASVKKELPIPLQNAIKADLIAHPDAFLKETLQAILEKQSWIEQESMLGGCKK